jgi:HD-like signal output (HDOD) protein
MTPSPPATLTRPPADLDGWVALFDPAGLPVLAETAAALEDWRAHEDAADAHVLAESFGSDPLMTLKLFAHVAGVARRAGRPDARSEVETVTGAIVMLGITPFFGAFGPQPVAEEWLAPHAGALEGFRAVLRRAHRAASFAIDFAVHRMDHDAVVLHEAALLHDFAELLLWLRAPTLAQEIARRQDASPGLRSAQVQREVLNIELAALQQRLMQAWCLPSLLVRSVQGERCDDRQVRTVALAVRVARHSARGWDNPALPDDVAEIADLLQMGQAPVRRLLLDIDAGQ